MITLPEYIEASDNDSPSLFIDTKLLSLIFSVTREKKKISQNQYNVWYEAGLYLKQNP